MPVQPVTKPATDFTDTEVKALRKAFEEFTGLKTYAARWMVTGGLFDADAPWDSMDEDLVHDFCLRTGLKADIRKTRLTVDTHSN